MEIGEVRDYSKESKDFDDSYIEINRNWEDIKQYLESINVTEKAFYKEWHWDWYLIKTVEGRTKEIWGEAAGSFEATLLYFCE